MCDIAPEVKEELRKFRFAKNNESSALICEFGRAAMFCQFYLILKHFSVKVDREKQIIVIDEHLEDVSVEELQVNLEIHGPINSHCVTHAHSFTGAVTITSASIRCLFLQDDPRRRPRFISDVLHLLHSERFNGKLN